MIKDKNIICFGFAEWDNPYKTNQHRLMFLFSKTNRVLFVESIGLRRPVFQKKDIKRIISRLVKWFKGIRRLNENLFILSPLVLPFHKYKFIRYINKLLLFIQLKQAIIALNFKNPIIWSYIPNANEFIGKLNESLSLYHCVDDISANPLVDKNSFIENENKLLSSVDIVVTTSKHLFSEKSKLNTNTHYLPNVADFYHFNKSILQTTKIPQDIEKIKTPILGFFGAISNYKIDFDLLSYLATRNANWNIVLIGDTGEGEKKIDTNTFNNNKNIYFLGPKSYELLPSYLKAFNVCLLPNRINQYTKNMFPLKFFEYLSSGKAIVSTNLDAIADFSNLCYISESYESFECNIKLALNENSASDIINKRIKTARNNTWEKRAEEFSELIIKYARK